MDDMDARQDQARTTPRLGRYEIDTENSVVRFATRHLFGLAPVRGTFAVGSGTADVAEPLGASTVRVEVDAASFRTRSGARDATVRSARFLDTAQHPVITFVSDRITPLAVAGTLTVCGTDQPVALTVDGAEVSAHAFTLRARTRVDRYAFGVTASRGMAGRHLDLTLEIRCVRV